ncbi:MAG: AIR synthase related protein, partial [Patescibacteria group bacterium]|nr:AIR synthase related protein [Patescibacteria group bacterium]
MIHTVWVSSRAGPGTARSDVLREAIRLGATTIETVFAHRVFRLETEEDFVEHAAFLATNLLTDPVTETWSWQPPAIPDGHRAVEVAYISGVMNPEAASIVKAAADLSVRLLAADSSVLYVFGSAPSEANVQLVIDRLLVNKTVQRVVTEPPTTLVITGEPGPVNIVPIRTVTDAELLALSENKLFLNLEEMRFIQCYFRELGRDPTDVELETIAQTWSEHCCHKTFRAQLEINGRRKPPMLTRIKDAARQYFGTDVLSAFDDNSGVLDFYDGMAVTGKVETHNAPSAIEPYGGAGTGTGGVIRDTMGTGLGAKPIASTDIFCFAPWNLPSTELPPGCLDPLYLLRQVVSGVRDYGNRMGIPTNNGSVHFHPDWRAKPTIIVGSYGIMPAALCQKGAPQVGDCIIVMGGRTGRDGIHGATFSSGAMTHRTITVNSAAVQIGNAIEEKRLLDAQLACRDAGLLHAVTDCGAG